MPTPPDHDESFFRNLVENASDLIFVVDAAGTIEYASPSVQRVLGIAPATLVGRPGLSLLHPDDVETALQALAAEIEGRTEVWYIEVRMRAADGTWIPLETKGRAEPNGVAPRLVIHARDLRERRRAEQQLRDQFAWTKALVETSPIAIITLDRSFTVTSWNPAAERIFGWSAHDVVGGRLPILPADSPEETEWLTQTIADGKTFSSYDTRRKRRDGRLVDVSISLAPIRTADGRIEGAIKLVADTTVQRALERQFQRAEQLDATGRLAGGIAHDFNNLLGLIMTSASLLRDETPEHSPSREDADSIINAARRASDLTRQLLTLARRKSPQTRRLDLGGFVGALQIDAREAANAATSPIQVQFVPGAANVHVIADPDQMREALLRLISNAIDAMPTGGTLTVETRVVELRGDEAITAQVHPGSYAMVAVSDNGVGMSADVLVHCFEPFFTTKERRNNPGLGLATAFAIVRQVGGGLSGSSARGIGTTMRLYLPTIDETIEPRSSTPRGTQPADCSGTILLVEDDGTFRAVVRRALAQHGYTVLDAGGGIEALMVVDQHPGAIDLLVTDLVMPGIGGRELARRLTALRPGLRVLYMSGYAPDVLRESGGLASSEAFIQKPFSPDDFVGSVRGMIDLLR